MSQESQHTEAIVDGDNDDASADQVLGVVAGAGPELEATTMDPDHDRPSRLRVQRFAVDVQVEAVFGMVDRQGLGKFHVERFHNGVEKAALTGDHL